MARRISLLSEEWMGVGWGIQVEGRGGEEEVGNGIGRDCYVK